MKCTVENVKKSYPGRSAAGFTNDKVISPGIHRFSLAVEVTAKINDAADA